MKHVKNAHMGTHLLVEVYNVPFEKLNDRDKIEQVCVDACKIEGLKVLNTYTHQFDPYGVTCTVTLGESHLSCHTWPGKRVRCNRYFHLWSKKSTFSSMVVAKLF